MERKGAVSEMTEYIKREKLLKDLSEIPAYFDSGDIRYGIEITTAKAKEQPTADVVEIDKVAEILADVTGASPCDFIGNEWLVSCCEYVGHCCRKSDGECWMQYLKYFGNEKEQCNENTR